MPSPNLLYKGGFTLDKFRGIVIHDIWPELIFFTCIATMVSCVSVLTPINLGISDQLLETLGTVLGLVLTFRTTSADDRYWEGRALWSKISLSSRNLASIVWVHVPTDRPSKPGDGPSKPGDGPSNPSDGPPKDAKLKAMIEKKSMINLIQAFSVSVKHYLRGEPGVYYQDLYPLIAFLPQYANQNTPMDSNEKLPLWADDSNAGGRHLPRDPDSGEGGFKRKKNKTFDPEKALPDVTPDDVHLAPARNPPLTTFFDYVPILMPIRSLYRLAKKLFFRRHYYDEDEDYERSAWTGRKRHRPVVESIVPLEIVLHLMAYFKFLLKDELLSSTAAAGFDSHLLSLQDASVQLRRVATTPIPFAYQVHLRMTTWLFLFFLPFQIYPAMKWLTIPATFFAAFLFLGFLEIGSQIENPFSYDPNALDIDGYCLSIARELAEITAQNVSPPSSYIFSDYNQPFAPADRRTAQNLVTDTKHEYFDEHGGMESLHFTLVRSWREVNEVTTHNKKGKINA
ncbi:UPF0187-domain-containing protein [Ceratobasidium sp. AG-I]|nr:UPF0187-domain-containing protein [Ceratobasidium sp. AG-I]